MRLKRNVMKLLAKESTRTFEQYETGEISNLKE